MKITSVFTWLGILAKRLFMRRSFIALLLIIPALGGLMALAAREDNGIETIILVAKGGKDEISRKIADSLLSEDSIIQFIEMTDEDAAAEQVRYGKADAAWILPEGMYDTIKKYAADPTIDVKFATVYQAKDEPVQRLVREKLNGAIISCLSPEIYETFREKVATVAPEPDKEEFEKYYIESAFKESIVNRVFTGYTSDAPQSTNYLTSPVRGLAALASFLCTLASTIYSMRDEKSGFASRLPVARRLPVLFATNLIAALASSGACVAAIAMSGNFTTAAREIPAAAAYALALASFCTALSRIFSSPFALGAAIPPVILVSAVLCPVFIGIILPGRPDMLLPVTYALRSVGNAAYLAYSLIYSASALALAYLADLLRRKRA